MFQDPSNPPDELAQNVSNKIPVGRFILPFFFESSESDRVFIYLHDSNSIFRARGIKSEWFRARTVWRPLNEEAQVEFKKRVVQQGDVNTDISLEEIQKQLEVAAMSRNLSTRTMRTYEESKVPEDVRHSGRAAALNERPIERTTHSDTSKTRKVQAHGQVSLDARESNSEKQAAGRFTKDRAVWREKQQRHYEEVYDDEVETAETQKERITMFKVEGGQHQDWTNAEITVDMWCSESDQDGGGKIQWT